MSKKQKQTEVEVKEPQIQEETVVIEQSKVKETPLLTPKNTWEIKDRAYFLQGRLKPLSRMIRSANIFWFD